MEFSFDIRGNLQPSEKITIDISTFEEYFVESFQNSNSRKTLYDAFVDYNHSFQTEITTDYIQWIDGSFVSNKLNPRDIDFVTIIDESTYNKFEGILHSKFRSRALKLEKGLDSYFMVSFPEEHPKYALFHSDSLYWYNFFTRTKKDRRRRQFDKGFIEITYK